MDEEEATGFVKGALTQAIKWDGSSGGVIRMVVLTAVCIIIPGRGLGGDGSANCLFGGVDGSEEADILPG